MGSRRLGKDRKLIGEGPAGPEPGKAVKIFYVEELTCDAHGGGRVMRYTGKVKACLYWKCSHGIHLMIWLQTEHSGMDRMDAVRNAIEDLINHNYYPRREMHFVDCNCVPDWHGPIAYDFSGLPDEWRELFESLFGDNWNIDRKHLPPIGIDNSSSSKT